MNMGSRKQAYAEERQRKEELAEYFASNPWRYGFNKEIPVQTRKTRKLFTDERFQFLRPQIRKEA